MESKENVLIVPVELEANLSFLSDILGKDEAHTIGWLVENYSGRAENFAEHTRRLLEEDGMEVK